MQKKYGFFNWMVKGEELVFSLLRTKIPKQVIYHESNCAVYLAFEGTYNMTLLIGLKARIVHEREREKKRGRDTEYNIIRKFT